MSVFFTADHHYGHANILRYAGRPYPTADAMDAALVDLWNDTVGRGDDVYVLGDFALGHRSRTIPIARRLHGHKYLLPGNHDGCWPGHRGHLTARAAYLDAGFERVIAPIWITIAGHDVALNHFPCLRGGTADQERYDERYARWRPSDDGGWLLHGHIHQHWRTRGRQINVGVDAWAGRPVPIGTIVAYVAADQPVHEPPLPWP
jgi:calcineurin-like phosphoesterase family protein